MNNENQLYFETFTQYYEIHFCQGLVQAESIKGNTSLVMILNPSWLDGYLHVAQYFAAQSVVCLPATAHPWGACYTYKI